MSMGSGILQGMLAGGAGLAAGMNQRGEMQRQRKAIETRLKTLMPDQADEFAGKSLSELQGLEDSIVMGRAQELHQAKMQEMQQREQTHQAQMRQAALQEQALQRQQQTSEAMTHAIALEQEALAGGGEFDRTRMMENYLSNGGDPSIDPSMLERYIHSNRDPRVVEANGVPVLVDPTGNSRFFPPDAGGGAFQGGPERSEDGQFFRSGPSDAWRPMPAERSGLANMPPGQLEIMNRRRLRLEADVMALQDQVAKGGWGTRKRREELAEKERQLNAIYETLHAVGRGGWGQDAPPPAPAEPPAAPAQPPAASPSKAKGQQPVDWSPKGKDGKPLILQKPDGTLEFKGGPKKALSEAVRQGLMTREEAADMLKQMGFVPPSGS